MPTVLRLVTYYLGKRQHGTVRPGAVDGRASWCGECAVCLYNWYSVQLTGQVWEYWGLGGGEDCVFCLFKE
jgi:hypothetical protein